MANVIGTKWGSKTLGTAGGTVSWSLAAAGTDISSFGIGTTVSTTGDTFLTYDYAQVIADAFAEWSKHGNIEFEQVEDQGGAAGIGAEADIRIFFGEIPGATAGYAFYPSAHGGAIGGDILLDTMAMFNTNKPFFESLVLHEIGHALGLGHADELSIMQPTIKKIGLQEDDIEGIIEIYGAQDNADPAPAPDPLPQPTPDPQPNPVPDPNENPENPGFTGDDQDNRIRGTAEADTIDGAAGDDVLRGHAGDDSVLGGEGHDTIHGGKGNDVLSGESADDLLKGKLGRDTLDGGQGADKLFGGRGRDLIDGGGSDDTLKGGGGADTLDGGNGNDLLIGGRSTDTFVFETEHDHDIIFDFNALNDDEKINFAEINNMQGFNDVLNNVTQVNDDVLIVTGADSSILLYDVNLTDLDAGDFIF